MPLDNLRDIVFSSYGGVLTLKEMVPVLSQCCIFINIFIEVWLISLQRDVTKKRKNVPASKIYNYDCSCEVDMLDMTR